MLLFDLVLQELNWRSVAKGRMLPFPIVENSDAFEGGWLDLGVRRVGNARLYVVSCGTGDGFRVLRER